ncbi:MAG: hypothetical protein FJ130_02225 [Deltaproteobacteria bacterium]|nr:hypothetical protein [Deltaproteobacteria bacterium]
MKKKLNLVFAAMVLALLSAFMAVEGAEAFCVYNRTDKVVRVEQVSGHKAGYGFSNKISPDDNKCCNWQTSDCNKEGNKDSRVSFDVFTEQREAYKADERICADFWIEAGGWMTVVKKHDDRGDYYTCERHK